MKHTVLQFSRYFIVGLLGSAIYAVIFACLNETVFPVDDVEISRRGVNYAIANGCAFICSSIFVFIQNRSWVFQSNNPSYGRQIVLFYLVAFIAWAIGTPIGAWLVTALGWDEYLALAVTISVSVFVNYVGRRYIVFGA